MTLTEVLARHVVDGADANAARIESELRRLIDAGHLVSHTARRHGRGDETLIMSGNLVLARIFAERGGFRFAIRVDQFDHVGGVPLEES